MRGRSFYLFRLLRTVQTCWQCPERFVWKILNEIDEFTFLQLRKRIFLNLIFLFKWRNNRVDMTIVIKRHINDNHGSCQRSLSVATYARAGRGSWGSSIRIFIWVYTPSLEFSSQLLDFRLIDLYNRYNINIYVDKASSAVRFNSSALRSFCLESLSAGVYCALLFVIIISIL